jgi:hypothetical protein
MVLPLLLLPPLLLLLPPPPLLPPPLLPPLPLPLPLLPLLPLLLHDWRHKLKHNALKTATNQGICGIVAPLFEDARRKRRADPTSGATAQNCGIPIFASQSSSTALGASRNCCKAR